MRDEFYALRNWEVSTGLQKQTTLENLGLGDIAGELKAMDPSGISRSA